MNKPRKEGGGGRIGEWERGRERGCDDEESALRVHDASAREDKILRMRNMFGLVLICMRRSEDKSEEGLGLGLQTLHFKTAPVSYGYPLLASKSSST